MAVLGRRAGVREKYACGVAGGSAAGRVIFGSSGDGDALLCFQRLMPHDRRDVWLQLAALPQDGAVGFFTITFDCKLVSMHIPCPAYAPPAFADSLYYMPVATPKGLLPFPDAPTLLQPVAPVYACACMDADHARNVATVSGDAAPRDTI